MSVKWQEVVATVAPSLATALAGPLAGLAVGAIGSVFGLDKATEEQVAQAISGANPADLLNLKKAEIDFKAHMADLDIDLERISAADRESARMRESSMAATGQRDWTPPLLATMIVGGYGFVQWFLLYHLVPVEMRDIIMRMLGLLDGALMLVLNYYFGSTAGSHAKDVTIAKIATQ